MMAAFAQEVELEGLRPDSNGVFCFKVDNMHIWFALTDDKLYFVMWSEVCDVPEAADGRLWRVLMQAMFEDRAINGDCFSIEDDSIFMHRREALAAIDLDRFQTVLGGFVNRLETWRNLIARFDSIEPELKSSEEAARQVQRQFRTDGYIKV